MISQASEPPDERPIIPHLHHRDALWKLELLFESLILHPIPSKDKDGTAKHINNRLHMLQTGAIKRLYDLSRPVVSLSPAKKKELADNLPLQQIQKNVQLAADLDNYKTAMDHLTQATPIALNNDTIIQILKSLYQKKHVITESHEEISNTNTNHDTPIISQEDF